MAEKKRFLLRVDAELYAALQRWAADEMRSVNAQIEFLLREAARRAGRGKAEDSASRSKMKSERKRGRSTGS